MKFQKLDINPAQNPAIMDTGTWDPPSALKLITGMPVDVLERFQEAGSTGNKLPASPLLKGYLMSSDGRYGSLFLLVLLKDGQHVILEFHAKDSKTVLSKPIGNLLLPNNKRVSVHPADADVLDEYIGKTGLGKLPVALGQTPRLGIGVRMTTACWPGIFQAMAAKKFAANTIQNSVRELNFLSILLSGQPAEKNYACGFGTIETGYTGSTFEGLWVSGVLETLKFEGTLKSGADADHVQVKRGQEGMARAKRYIESCRYYSFYTLDMADVLDYYALKEESDAAARHLAESKIPDSTVFKQILAYHQQRKSIYGQMYYISEAVLFRLIGKYWSALADLEELTHYIRSLKKGRPFDLEFTIDEHPAEIGAFDCLTSREEYLFVLREIERRDLPVTHIAPNIGVEKGFDYRCPDGLEGLQKRTEELYRLSEFFGKMLDVHSADDLTAATRRVIRQATGGKLHYKISPSLQLLYAEVLQACHPDLFLEWWNDAMNYACCEAAAGSPFAKHCLSDYQASPDKKPSRHHMVFHHYSFAFVGKRDANGQFLNRARFYELSRSFYNEYENRLAGHLSNLAEELF